MRVERKVFMEIKKFPVYSKSGEEYLATIEECRFQNNAYTIKLFRSHESKSYFLKRKKVEWIELYTSFALESNWHHDFISMVKRTLVDYEDKLEKSRLRKEEIQMQTEKFNNWNGK